MSLLILSVGWGQTGSITITNASIGGSAILGSNNYNSGAERVWVQNTIEFGGKAITCNNTNSPTTGTSACQYIQAQSNNGVIYNTTALPGRIVSITFNGTANVSSLCYGGNSRLVNTTSANYTVGGTMIGLSQTGTSYTWNTTSNENYTFFCVKRGGSVQYFSSIVVVYELNTSYSVTFNPNGGSGAMSPQSSSSAAALTTNSFTRAGYTFSGWNTAVNGTGTAYANGATYNFTASTTLYAQWSPNSLTVTYDSQGGTSITNGSTVTGGSLNDPGSPTQTGYNFLGWFSSSTGGSAINFPYAHGQTADFTLFAQWAAANAPILEQTANSISGLTVVYNAGSSSTSTISISGSNLNGAPGSISISGLTNFEVSTDDVAYSTTAIIPYTSSTLVSTMLYFRLKSGLSVASYNETVTISGGGATNLTLALSGSVTQATPVIQIAPSASAINYLEALSASTLSGGSANTAGTFTFQNSAIIPSSTGSYIASVVFTPSDAINFTSAITTTDVLVNPADQTITFNSLPLKVVGDANFNLTASSTSGLVISYSSSNTAVATISGSTITIVGAGTTTITANQSGDQNYNAASPVEQILEVKEAIVKWTFEGISLSSTAGTQPNLTSGGFAADLGINANNSTFTGLHASSSTVWSDPQGINSVNSFSSNNWSINDYYGFSFSTTGFSDVVMNFYQLGSSTGPRDFKVQYSTNGSSFTDILNATYQVSTSWANQNFQLPSVLNNQSIIYIRLVSTSNISISGSTVGTGGTSRVDDFLIYGEPCPLPSVSVASNAVNNTICSGSSVEFTASASNVGTTPTYQWYNNGTAISGATSATYTSTTLLNLNVITVQVTSTCGTTALSNAVVINVNDLPSIVATSNAPANTICVGSEVVLSASGAATYSWNNSIQDGVSFTPSATSSYHVTGTDVNGCQNTASITVTVNALTLPTFTQVAPICSGASLSALPTTSNNGIDGTWSPAMDNTTTTTYTFTPATGSCASSTTMEILVNALPTVSVVASPEFICAGASSTLTATGASSYLWGTTATSNSIVVSPTSTTTYSMTGTDANGCVASGSATITVDQPVTPTFDQVAAICSGTSLSALPTTSNNGIDGTWSPAMDNTATTTYTFTPAAGTCATGTTMQIVVNALPTVNATSSVANVCSGASATLTATGADTYTWDNGSTGSSILVSPTTATTYTVTGTTTAGCTSTASVTVGTIAAPVITSPTTVSCNSAQVTMTSSVTSGIQWYRGTTLLNGATSATYSSNVAGTYTVKLSACPSTVSNGISITTGSNPAAPNAVVQSGSLLLCGPSAQVVLQSTVAPSGTTGVQWYLNGSAISGATAQTYTTSTPGSYDVRRVQLSSGCSSSASTALAVVAGTVPTTPVVSLQSGALSLCSGATSTLASDVLPSASVSLQWYKDGVVQSAATAATLVANAAGSYAVKATDVSGCASALSNGVALTAVPTAVISAPSLSICNSAPVTLTSNVTNNIQWYKTGVLISGATSATYSATTAGTYTVKSTLCPLQVSNSLAVITGSAPAAPTVSSPIGAVVCSSSPITLQSSIAPSGTNSLQWYKDGAAISGATAQTYSTAVAGSYTVRRIQVSSGCPSVSSNAISVTNGGSTPSGANASVQGGGLPYICSSTTNNVVLQSSVAPTGSTGIQWYNGSTPISGATAVTYTASVAGVYSVRRVTTTGCSSAPGTSVTITVGSIPSTAAVTAINGGGTVVCGTTPVTLQSSVAPTQTTTLQWYKNGTAVFNGTNVTLSTLSEGSYTVRRIANCPSLPSNAITVTAGTIPSAPVLSVQSGNLATCAGVPVVLSSSVAPGSGTTLQWFSTNTALSNATAQTYSTAIAGSYRVKATSGGCTSPYSNSLTVSVISAPGTASISVYSGSLTLCNGSTVTFKSQHAVTNSIGVRWYKDGVEIAGAISQYYTASTPGVYTARRINSYGCLGNASSPLTVISCNPIVVNDNNEEQEDATSKLDEELVWTATATTNPFEQSFKVNLNGAEAIDAASNFTAQFTDMSGKVYTLQILNKEALTEEHFGHDLAPGMYMLTLSQGTQVQVLRVVKK